MEINQIHKQSNMDIFINLTNRNSKSSNTNDKSFSLNDTSWEDSLEQDKLFLLKFK